MRHLNAKQKKLIKQHVDKNGLNDLGLLHTQIDDINCYENSWTDCDRFAEDYYYEQTHDLLCFRRGY